MKLKIDEMTEKVTEAVTLQSWDTYLEFWPIRSQTTLVTNKRATSLFEAIFDTDRHYQFL